MRTFVIGDIHGCFDELLDLTEKIRLQDQDLLISAGDIVDRGAKSMEVYKFFRNRPNSIVLMGNHEKKHLRGIYSYSQEIVKIQFGEEYPEFIEWLKGLKYFYETEYAIIVHAALEHDKPLKDQKEEVLCGSTSGEQYLKQKYSSQEEDWSIFYNGEKPVIYGHRVFWDQPRIKYNTYGIDTGCCIGSNLTAIELPGFIIHQVEAKKNYWKEEQKKWQVPVLKSKGWKGMEFSDIKKKLAKLSHIKDPESKEFIDYLHRWLSSVENSFIAVKEEIDRLTEKLLENGVENFSAQAGKYFFNEFLFKSKKNILTLENLRTRLNTPEKILELCSFFGIEVMSLE